MFDTLNQWLSAVNLPETAIKFAGLVGVLLFALFANWIVKRWLVPLLERFIKSSPTEWDDIFLENNVVRRISHLTPAIVINALAPMTLAWNAALQGFMERMVSAYFAIVVMLIMTALVDAAHAIYEKTRFSEDLPVHGIRQALKIVICFVGVVAAIAYVVGKAPWALLGGMGVVASVLILVFKDTLLNFVGYLEILSTRPFEVGDWIEVPRFQADGDVVGISLNSIKVQNWTKTISIIPTKDIVATPVINWSGMFASGGRRVKRSIDIDVSSIGYLKDDDIARLTRIQILKPYIDLKMKELKEHNEKHNIDETVAVNGRRLTNVGVFRAYIEAYLKSHPLIHKDGMTFLVRQLQPTEHGLPLQVYVFTTDTRWTYYEGIQADIFDHLIAAIPHFGLRVFQNPSGNDFQHVFTGADDTAPAYLGR